MILLKKSSTMLDREDFIQLPIFITSMSRLDDDLSSASIALAKVLSRTNQVFYIEYPFSWLDIFRRKNYPKMFKRLPALLLGRNPLLPLKGRSKKLLGALPRPGFPIFSLPLGVIHSIALQYNNRLIIALMNRIIKERKISNYIFINSFNPVYLSKITQHIQPAFSVYHSRDAIEELKREWLNSENDCVQAYDMAMASSKKLCRNLSERNSRPINYFPNGGDCQLFKKAIGNELPIPIELAEINTPIIGYTGAVCQRIDYELLEKIAFSHKDKTIVLVGPRRDKANTLIDLDSISNIVFIDSKKIDELPAYLSCFDCAIIPFVKNNLTAGIYPLKINEYLAAGRAVVTTNFSEDISDFTDQVYLANNHEEFLQMVEMAVKDNCFDKVNNRLRAAETNSWEHRVEFFWQLAWESYQKKSALEI